MLIEPQMVAAFNEWMRRYIEEPERYEREIQTVRQFLEEDGLYVEASYGRECAAYLIRLSKELEGVSNGDSGATA